MTTTTTPETPATPAAPTGPVKVDPLNPAVAIPVYLGGEGPVPMPTGGDRGDNLEPAKPAAAAAAPAPLPQGTVATAVAAETAGTPAAAPPVPGVGEEADDGSTGEPADTGGKPAEVVATAEPTDQGDKPRNEKGQFIPRSRFNEVNEERKRLAARVAELEGQQGAAKDSEQGKYDFAAKEKEYVNLVLDGKLDEASKLRLEIREAERAQFIQDARQATVETTQQLTVKERIEQISERYATQLPAFDPESDDYSEELLTDVRDIYSGMIESGRYADPAVAFETAITKAMKLHGLNLPAEQPKPTPAPATPATPDPARTAQKRVEAIVKQPPSVAGVGTTGAPETAATIDVKTLSDADFAKLPEATRRRLRGDMV